jgi:hypothetical protein
VAVEIQEVGVDFVEEGLVVDEQDVSQSIAAAP